jgi:hypothetical protein
MVRASNSIWLTDPRFQSVLTKHVFVVVIDRSLEYRFLGKPALDRAWHKHLFHGVGQFQSYELMAAVEQRAIGTHHHGPSKCVRRGQKRDVFLVFAPTLEPSVPIALAGIPAQRRMPAACLRSSGVDGASPIHQERAGMCIAVAYVMVETCEENGARRDLRCVHAIVLNIKSQSKRLCGGHEHVLIAAHRTTGFACDRPATARGLIGCFLGDPVHGPFAVVNERHEEGPVERPRADQPIDCPVGEAELRHSWHVIGAKRGHLAVCKRVRNLVDSHA